MKMMEELLSPPQEAREEAAPAAEEPGQDTALEAAPAAPDPVVLVAERDRALAEKQEIWDRLLRAQAEMENSRKRSTREKEEVLQFAAMETIRTLLPALDDFERALKIPADGEEYRKGIELIYKRVHDTLVRAGLSPIQAQGKRFDPHLHQAVDTIKTEDQEDQTVVEEYQRGYEFKGRLLRPAMVRVAVKE